MKVLTVRSLSGLFIVGVLGFALILSAEKSIAIDQNWINHTDIRFEMLNEFEGNSQKPSTTFGGNRDCIKREVMIKPDEIRLFLPDLPPAYSSDCMIDTAYGAVGSSYYQRTGTSVAGSAMIANKKFLIAGSNSSKAIVADTSSSTGSYLGFLANPLNDIETIVQSDKTVKHQLKTTAQIDYVTNHTGNKMTARYETIAFSSGGEWMVFESPTYGFVRVNTSTGEVLAFGFGNSNNLSFKFAISSDGRYVIASTVSYFGVFDLGNCTPPNGAGAYLMNCQFRSLHSLRLSKASFGLAPFIIRFTGKDSFTYYIDQLVGSKVMTRQYRVTMGEVPGHNYGYLGLGDSFASGEGAFNYKLITQEKCHVALSSYPFLVGAELGVEDFESVACSGARTQDVFLPFLQTDNYEGQVKDGLDQKTRLEMGQMPNIISGFLPGKVTQNTFLEYLKPEIVTISIGGNDLAFAEKIKTCIAGIVPDSTCFDTQEERYAVANEIYKLSETLITTYQKLKGVNTRVYVIGYPKIVAQGDCAVNVKLNSQEIDFADKLTTLLNDAIEFASGQAGVVYVDVENIFAGRRLCETTSENTLVHGITEDHTKNDLQLATESFHPKIEGHIKYKEAIIAQTNNLTKIMPTPNQSTFMPRLAENDEFFSAVNYLGGTIYAPIYEDFANEQIIKDQGNTFNIDAKTSGFGSFASVQAEIQSSPTPLGNFTTDVNGNLVVSLTIPQSIEPGFHSIHLFGKNQTGQSIDLYDYVWVGASSEDFDGDGVLNQNESCVFVVPVGSDTDQDGIDDACDDVNDPLPADEQEQLVDVPDFFSNPDKPTDNNETVAGNEQMNSPESENLSPTLTTGETQATRTTPDNRVAVTDEDNQEDQASDVLSENITADNNDSGKNTVPSSKLNDKTLEPSAKNSRVYLYYFLAGVIAFIALVTFLLMAMKKQKK